MGGGLAHEAGTGFLDQVTVLMLTYNEAPNIDRSLSALSRFSDVVVLDSFSDDLTSEIVAGFRNTRLHKRAFDNHASQWNFGLQATGIDRPWVLALDADYVVPEALVDEISRLKPDPEIGGYSVSFRYCIQGHALSGSLYPSHIALFRRTDAHYVQHGHTQRLFVSGKVVALRARIDHDDRKPLARWLRSQHNYARLEVDYLLSLPRSKRRRVDRVRLTGVLAPPLVFLYTLIARGCIFNGWHGWMYVLQRTVAEVLIAVELIDRRLASGVRSLPRPPEVN